VLWCDQSDLSHAICQQVKKKTFQISFLLKEAYYCNIIFTCEVLKGSNRSQFLGAGTHRCLHASHNARCFSRAILILREISIPKYFKGWVACNTKFVTGFFPSFGAVPLGQYDRWIVLFDSFCSLRIFGFQLFTMSTPWGIKHDKYCFMFCNYR